ncbi:hypothetical protein QBC47DRAFT_325843 [Echria macrotheca]|uniref:Nucleoporin Pom152 n=1 Tax=Echria macrotheca TaxID=438768 RepID=A0AAJ0B8K9_9PEZI|nr:hypothetical protein QBC47DRAFT_325843 [Echria macrotheca]
MNVGAFPQTPVVARHNRPPPAPPANAINRPDNHNNAALPEAPRENAGRGTRTTGPGPVIPLNIMEAPTQRFYAFGIYVALFAWKFYDWAGLVEENAESFWLFLKWIAIDFAFLFGLPEMRIPWLELSQPFVVAIFLGHAVLNWMLMFNVGLPWQAWILGFVKVFYDRELAISEHNVKLSSILHNQSLIMGRQVINILPEGSAVLNPEQLPFCLGPDNKYAPIPIYFNATTPIEVEITRTDLETNQQEVIKLTKSQLREIERKAKIGTQDPTQAVVQFDFPAKKPGVYQLGKVLDEYKLQVQRLTPTTFVVQCPHAWVAPVTDSSRCIGDLSDLTLQVSGTPPLKVVYGRTIDNKDRSLHVQSLQPDGFTSPLTTSLRPSALVVQDDEDISWARPQRIPVPLNESMVTAGDWQYSIDEVHDGFGNVVKYASPADDPEGKPKPKHLVQNFWVKQRPQIHLEGCDMRTPLKIAKGASTALPVRFDIPPPVPYDTSHQISWQFSPIDTLTKDGDHGDVVSTESYNARHAEDRPKISAPGLYTLKKVSASSCEGEVQEPASCLLLNPLEPKLTLRSEDIPDTCAGNTVGLKVDLDLIGTPPFVVWYDQYSNGEKYPSEKLTISGMRYQVDLEPRLAGHHKYIFTHISDAIYKDQKLVGPGYVFEQDVKPAANAFIQSSRAKASACLGDEAEIDVVLFGDGPFTLDWEVVFEGKRKRETASGIEEHGYQIKTAPLTKGGEYTIALISVQDKRGCKTYLKEEKKISVRRQSPRAAFGQIDHRRKVMAVEGATQKLPLRLTGEGPWKVVYTNLNETSPEKKVTTTSIRNDNGFLEVKGRGVFEITSVWDSQCPGTIDPKTSRFEVDWFPKPELGIVLTHSVSEADGKYIVAPVCEGDVSGFELSLKGAPPYHVNYEVRHDPLQVKGSSPASSSRKQLDAPLGKVSIQAETARSGTYTYKFTSLADNLYNSEKNFKPIVVQQKVNRKPSAAFAKPGQTFKFCRADESDAAGIPVVLTGVPPFNLEVEIKHNSAASPEIYRTPPIHTHTYDVKIPKHLLRLGTQYIRIRDVKDGSNCHSISDLGGASVQVQLYEAPTIYPLETRTDYCVGERLSYTLSGTPPFEVWYTFDDKERKAKSPTTNFRRIAESPGVFSIKTVSDKASSCRAPVDIVKTIHPMPAVKISKGQNVQVDIHEGSEVEILFEFWGTPPFEFTYTRSTNARKGQKSQVLETRHDISHEHSKVIRASQEGTYEVVAIKDKFCAFSTMQGEIKEKPQKLLKYA